MPVVLKLHNDYSELPRISSDVTAFLEDHGGTTETAFAANLAIEEMVTNIIKYGYDDEGRHEIDITLSAHDGSVWIEIRDDGHEFNPFEHPEPDTSLPADDREIGGLGIHFVRNMLDTYKYERTDGQNVVTLSKKL